MIGVCIFGFMGLLLMVEFSQGNVSTVNGSAAAAAAAAAAVTPKAVPTTTKKKAKDSEFKEVKDLPHKGAAEVEHQSSLTIFFIILVVGKWLVGILRGGRSR